MMMNEKIRASESMLMPRFCMGRALLLLPAVETTTKKGPESGPFDFLCTW
jgi:hypothetical protein